MCAGAIVHARVKRVVYAASDPRSGAAGSVFDLLPSDQRFNHRVESEGGLLSGQSANRLRDFFRARRNKDQNKRDIGMRESAVSIWGWGYSMTLFGAICGTSHLHSLGSRFIQ